MFEIGLGEKVKDSITGFEGVVVARAEYLNGCVSYQVEGKDHEKEFWFDEQRLTIKSRARAGGGLHAKPPAMHP